MQRAEFKRRLAELQARTGKSRARADIAVKFGLIAMLLLPSAFGVFAWQFAADAWRAVSGGKSLMGTVHAVDAASYSYEDSDGMTRSGTSYIIHVAFASDSGKRLIRPLQHGGAGDEDTGFAQDILDIDDYRPGTVVHILYHPELGDRIWLDDFRALWLLPLILGGATLMSGFLAVGGLIVLWPRRLLSFEEQWATRSRRH